MNGTGPYWWLGNVGSDNGLVISVTNPLSEPMLTEVHDAVWRHWATTILVCTEISQALHFPFKPLVKFQLNMKISTFHSPGWKIWKINHGRDLRKLANTCICYAAWPVKSDSYCLIQELHGSFETVHSKCSFIRNKGIKALFHEVMHPLVAVPTDDVLTKADSRLRAHHKYKFQK